MDELIGQNHRVINSGFDTSNFFKRCGEPLVMARYGTFYWVNTVIVPFLTEERPLSIYIDSN